MGDHGDHGRWEKVGACVWCPCGARLYQGDPPDTEAEQGDTWLALEAILEAVRAKYAAAQYDGTGPTP